MASSSNDEELWFDRLRDHSNPKSVASGGLTADDLEDARVLGVALTEQLNVLQSELVVDDTKTQAYLFMLRQRGLMDAHGTAQRQRRQKISLPRPYAIAAMLVLFALIPVVYFSVGPGRDSVSRDYYGSRLVEQSIRVADPQAYSAALLNDLKDVALEVKRSMQVGAQTSYWLVQGRFVNPPDKPTRRVIAYYKLDRKKMRAVGAAAEFQLRITAR